MEVNKYRLLFLVICLFIGFAIYLNSGKVIDCINTEKLSIENIKDLEIRKLDTDKRIRINNPDKYKFIISGLLSSKRIRIKDVRNSRRLIYCTVNLNNGKKYFLNSRRECKLNCVKG